MLYRNINKAMISIEQVENKYDRQELRNLIEAHVKATGSELSLIHIYVEPGEMVIISREGIRSNRELAGEKTAHCVFEYIYFARLDSVLDGVGIYDARIRGGKSLARSYPVEADLVTGVPDSGIPAAKGYSQESGIPFYC